MLQRSNIREVKFVLSQFNDPFSSWWCEHCMSTESVRELLLDAPLGTSTWHKSSRREATTFSASSWSWVSKSKVSWLEMNLYCFTAAGLLVSSFQAMKTECRMWVFKLLLLLKKKKKLFNIILTFENGNASSDNRCNEEAPGVSAD